MGIRTDLACEAQALWQQQAGKTTQLPGVRAWESSREGIAITTVKILDKQGETALGKPAGTYITLALEDLDLPGQFDAAARSLALELRGLLQLEAQDAVLVVGLGNSAVTPDAIGPRTLEQLLVTRHLVDQLPRQFGVLRPVSALSPGVLGTTGLESLEVVRGVVERTQPKLVIVVDALASRSPERICATAQLTDTGIVPGSGVGNSRQAFDRGSLGVDVVAVGVPTVVDAATLAADLTEKVGTPISSEALSPFTGGLIVTPRQIDQQLVRLSRVLAFGINLALQPNLTLEELRSLQS